MLFTDPILANLKWLNVNTIIDFDHTLFFHLLINDHFQGDFLNKLYI